MDILENLKDYILKIENKNEEFKQSIEQFETNQKDFSNLYKISLTTIENLQEENSKLKNNIKALEDDILDLTKVSRIIAFENENNSLKLEIKSLKNRLELFKNKKEFNNKDIQTEQIMNDNQTQYLETDLQEENELTNFNIKNIKGIDYYVSKIEPKLVYEKTLDGIGILRGTITKNNGKTKISWIN